MAKLSKIDAAKTIGVSRQTLYNYIKLGRITVDPDGTIDTAELLRAGFLLLSIDSKQEGQTRHDLTAEPSPLGHPESFHIDMLTQLTAENAALQRERDLLQRELNDAKHEKAQLLELLKSQQRLLEAGQKKSWWARVFRKG